MFSHVVIFWTKKENPNAADEIIAGAEKYLRPIPGAIRGRVGPGGERMARPAIAAFLGLMEMDNAAAEARYEAWHASDHLPENKGILGVVYGNRWRAAREISDQVRNHDHDAQLSGGIGAA